jgi:hypothetical protein
MLAGDIWVGLWDGKSFFPSPKTLSHHDGHFSISPTTLTYRKLERQPVRELGVEPRWHHAPGFTPFENPTFDLHPRPDDLPWPDTLFSEAPLQGVVRAAVYRHKLANPAQSHIYHCTGILFTYQNGGQRAVGECRLGLDDCVVYDKPFEMVSGRFQVTSSEWHPKRQPTPVLCLWVEFRTEEEEEAETSHLTDSQKRPMDGRVGFWMTKFHTFVTYSSGTADEVVERGWEAGSAEESDGS